MNSPIDARKLWQRIGLRVLLFTALMLMLIYCFPFFWRILGPFLVALAIAAALQPALKWLGKLKVHRGVGTLLLLFLFYMIIAFLIYLFSSFVVTQAINALNNAPQWISGLNQIYQNFRTTITTRFENTESLKQLDSLIDRAYQQLTSWATRTAGSLVGSTVNLAVSVPNILIFANFLLLSSFFLTRDFPILFPAAKKSAELSHSAQMRHTAIEAIAGYLRMQVIYTIFVLIVSIIGFTAFSMPYGFLIAALAGLLEFLPLFGNGTLYVPMIIILFLLGEYRFAFVTLGVHLILYITRKVTEPHVMNQQMGLSPVLSLLSMYIGLQTFGVIGLTVSPIVMVVLQTGWKNGLYNGAIQDVKDAARWIHDFLHPAQRASASQENQPQHPPQKSPASRKS